MLQARLGVEPFSRRGTNPSSFPLTHALGNWAGFACWRQGCETRIAETLFIGVRTAEGHVARILAKLSVASRVAAINAATARGLANIDF